MSEFFYNRIAKFTLSRVGAGGVLSTIFSIQTPAKLTFECSKTEVSSSNVGTITISGLQKETRESIVTGRNIVGILEAGYVENDGLQLMFYGDVVEVNHQIQKPDVVTSITIADGFNAIKEKRINISFKKKTPLSQIVKKCIESIGLPVNSTFSYLNLPNTMIESTIAYTGAASELLDRMCEDNGLQWSVQNGSVKICSVSSTDNVVHQSSFIKNMITQTETDFNGYEFDALLMPKVEPYGKIKMQSSTMQEPVNLRVSEVKHSGDFWGDKWTTTVKARDL